jgi:nucleoside-diphosphate-sugar epimerase
MKIAVTGASGFIGGRFVELFKDKFEIIKLNSKNGPLDNYNKLIDKTEGCDILIHAAFDHNYKDNIIGIKNILKVCEKNKIKKLIYLSSISVYDPDINGILDENSPYSNLNDPYSKEKRKIEKIIENFKEKNEKINIIILQPTIVYGFRGNWTKYALHVCKSQKTILPNNGRYNANIIYVDDVANAIYQSIYSNINYGKFLISNETITWKEFYCKQCQILEELNLPSNCNIQDVNNWNEFHSNTLINFIFILWFKTIFGNLFNMIVGKLKKLRAKNYNDLFSNEILIKFLKSSVSSNILRPSGITKKVHSSKFIVNTKKAEQILNFTPKYSFDYGLRKIKEDLQRILK